LIIKDNPQARAGRSRLAVDVGQRVRRAAAEAVVVVAECSGARAHVVLVVQKIQEMVAHRRAARPGHNTVHVYNPPFFPFWGTCSSGPP